MPASMRPRERLHRSPNMWGWSSLETLSRDARYALRGMRRSPGFTAVALLSLALGIGANTAIFSLIDALMLRRLPVHDPGRLVELMFKAPGQDHFNAFDWRGYRHCCDNNHGFSGLIASSGTPFAIHGDGLEPEIVRGGFVTPNYLSVLGLNPALGRLIGVEDGGVPLRPDHRPQWPSGISKRSLTRSMARSFPNASAPCCPGCLERWARRAPISPAWC